jgi:methionyl-tRNA formyltransferase
MPENPHYLKEYPRFFWLRFFMLELGGNRRVDLRIVFMGSPEYALSPLRQLIQDGHSIAAVYTRPDKPAGRGRDSLAPPLKKAALSLGLQVVQVAGFKLPAAQEQLAKFQPQAVVVAAFGQILPQAVLDLPEHGCLNIHPSLLPRYRGASPVPAAILNGDDYAGVSLMRLDAGMDTGPVFSRAQIPILPWDTAGSLTGKLFQMGAFMLSDVLAELPEGGRRALSQNEAEATYTREISKEEGRLDWSISAQEIWRRVRAYQPWPEAYTTWQGKHLKIIEAVPLALDMPCQPGLVVSLSSVPGHIGSAFGVGTGRGILGVLKVQIEGKRAMSAGEFLRGQRDFTGCRLG